MRKAMSRRKKKRRMGEGMRKEGRGARGERAEDGVV
jgi:hypothetical protein